MVAESAIVKRYFSRHAGVAAGEVGVGDDAAVIDPAGRLAVSCDTLVAGTHFAADADPYLLGRKALAVNLSDLAAMGARPKHALLALTLPEVDEAWLEKFSQGFYAVGDEHGVRLIGGDLARGPAITISVTVIGQAPQQPLLQSGAEPGDDLWLTGCIGQADAQLRAGQPPTAGSALHDPHPQVAIGMKLAGAAKSAVDLSDGLCASALLVARASGVRLQFDAQAVPLGDAVAGAGVLERLQQAACGGEDYELLFSADPAKRTDIGELSKQCGQRITLVGKVVDGHGIIAIDGKKTLDFEQLAKHTYSHFSTSVNSSIEALAARVGQLCKQRGLNLAVAESCTGGLLAAALTAVAGASEWFNGGVVSYTAAAKQELLNVPAATIRNHTVVSSQVAAAMCEGVMRTCDAQVAASVTGWAGPGAADGQQPGTVCIGLGVEDRRWTKECLFSGDRQQVREQAVRQILLELAAALSDGES